MKKIFAFAIIILTFLSFHYAVNVHALVCGEEIPAGTPEGVLRDYMADCNKKIEGNKGAQATLAAAINYFNGQIGLTQAQIVSTQKELDKLELEIDDLSGKINTINVSLDDLTRYFISRVRESYKGKDNIPYTFVFNRGDFGNLVRQVEYVRRVRDHDKVNLLSLEKSRLDLGRQKEAKEIKQAEVEALKKKLSAQKSTLSSQKVEKDRLLLETKNSEKEYQRLLAQARAELIAIQGIIAGLGKEVKIGAVDEGARVASIIQGASPCSTGTHLHFEVARSGARHDPFSKLRSINLNWDNADAPQNGNGDWSWPLNDPIRITQGYGHTAYSSRYADDIHTGVDMVSSDATVKAVRPGELYQGSMKCGSGNLIYVRVKQSDGYDTYYLHVNY